MIAVKRTPLWPDPRVKPPYGSVVVDPGHPLAPSSLCLLMNEGGGAVSDLAGGQRLAISVSAALWSVGPHGVALDITNTSQQKLDPWPAIPRAGYTVTLRVTSNGTGDAYVFFFGGWDFTPPYVTVRTVTSSGLWQVLCGSTFDCGAFTANESVQFAITVDAAGNGKAYRDGVLQASAAGQLLTTAIARLLFNGSSFGPTPGFLVSHLMVYPFAFSQSVIQELQVAPYLGLRPLIRRRYFVPSAVVNTNITPPTAVRIGA